MENRTLQFPISPTPPGAVAEPAAASPEEPQIGANWGRFRIERLLGEGGMGRVFLADDPSLERKVALKLLRLRDTGLEARFLAEARAQAKVEHENICRVNEVGTVGGSPYIAMQYIGGGSLATAAAELNLEGKTRLFLGVVRGVAAAHQAGLIHRDLKPANILVERGTHGEFHPYVTDFGIARFADAPGLTRTGHVMGSVEYLPPEVASGENPALGPQFDIWGLGVTFYEILAGRTPYAAETELKVLSRLLQEPPEPIRQLCPSLPADLANVVMRCLERDPARRYASADALAADLERFLAGERVQAQPQPWPRRRWLAAVLAAALILVAAVAWLWPRDRVIDPPHGVLLSDLGGEPREVVELIEKGMASRRAGKNGEAILLLKAAASRSRRSALPVMFAGLSELSGGQDEAAGASFAAAQQLLQAHPNPFALLLLRYLQRHGGSISEQQAAATALLATRPTAYHARLALSHLSLNRGDRATALSHLQQIQPGPGLGRAVALAAADRGSLGDLAGAREFLARLPDLEPAARHYAQGRLARTEGELEEALAELDLGTTAASRSEQPTLESANLELAALVAAELSREDAFSRLRLAAQKARDKNDRDAEMEVLVILAALAHRRGDNERRDQAWAEAERLEKSLLDRAMFTLTAPLVGLTSATEPRRRIIELQAEDSAEVALIRLLETVEALAMDDPDRARNRLASARAEGFLDSWPYGEYLLAYDRLLGGPPTPCRIDPPFPNRLRFVACWVAGEEPEAKTPGPPSG